MSFTSMHNSYLDSDPYWAVDEPPPHPKCQKCGAFLRLEPERTERWDYYADPCDGTVRMMTCRYSEMDIRALDVGGVDHAPTYELAVSQCGIDRGPHEPHHDLLDSGLTEYRHCRKCGTEDKRSDH